MRIKNRKVFQEADACIGFLFFKITIERKIFLKGSIQLLWRLSMLPISFYVCEDA